MRLINHMLMKLDDDMKGPGAHPSAQDASVVIRLVDAMVKLDAIQRTSVQEEMANTELADIRDKLVRRIDELRRNN